MKHLLNALAVILLTGAFLYPLFFSGTGRHVLWRPVILMAVGGSGCLYFLFRFRKGFDLGDPSRIDKIRSMEYK